MTSSKLDSDRSCDLNTLMHLTPFSQVCVRKSFSSLFVPWLAENNTLLALTGGGWKDDEALLAKRIKDELGDDFEEQPLVLRDQVK